MLPKAIGLIGEGGSGKTTAWIYIHDKHPAYRQFSFGHLWYDKAVRLGKIRAGQVLPDQLKSDIARQVMAKDKLYAIKKMKELIDITRPVIVDGIREQEAIEYLQKSYGKENVVLVGIIADYKTRRARLKDRDNYTAMQFGHREKVDGRFEIQKLIDQCDYCLGNSRSVEKLFIPSIDLLYEVLKQRRN